MSKAMMVVILCLGVAGCNLKVQQTPGPVEQGYQQHHTQIDFDMYPACVGSCKQ